MKSFHSRVVGLRVSGWGNPFLAPLVFITVLGVLNFGFAVTLSPPTVQSGVVSFTFDSAPGQLLVVQQSTSLNSGWTDVAYRLGDGSFMRYSAPTTTQQQFFRVKVTPSLPLALSPSSPSLTSGAVSLPDALVGEAYFAAMTAELTGLPPYTLAVSGTPPGGTTLVVTNNQSGKAAVQLIADGTGLVAGQRRQFTVTVTDSMSATTSRTYDLRVVEPPPRLTLDSVVLKAGEARSIQLAANGGTGPLTWSLASGPLPEGMSVTSGGLLRGTPSANASERNENGRYPNLLEVADSFTDRVTGAPAPRRATGTLPSVVRLSYVLNIHALRDNGPSLQDTCTHCHGQGFTPDLDAPTALAIINVNSGSGGLCGTSRVYITPGDLLNSLIYGKITAPPCGERMPFGGPYLSDQRLGRVMRWILELTPQDTD
jgi:hypothetical protein